MSSEGVQTSQKTSGGVNVTVNKEYVSPEGVKFNPRHFITIPGILKLVEVVIGIICMACASPVVANYTHFFMFVVALCFISSVAWCLIYLFCLQSAVSWIPWLILELASYASSVLLYFIAVVVQLAMTNRHDYYIILSYYRFYNPYMAAGGIAVFNLVAYILSTMFVFKDWHQSRSPRTATNGNS